MDKQITSFVVCVIGNDEAFWNAKARVAVKLLDDLSSLGPRGGAEIHHSVVRLHVQEKGRDHRHRLLAGDVTALLNAESGVGEGEENKMGRSKGAGSSGNGIN